MLSAPLEREVEKVVSIDNLLNGILYTSVGFLEDNERIVGLKVTGTESPVKVLFKIRRKTQEGEVTYINHNG